jgi:tRNA(Ile)-lysidine synthase
MAVSLLDAVRTAVRRYGLLRKGDVVLAAVSGGADSVALLAALHELRGELGIELRAAHLDHGLRGAESTADREFVEALARDLAVPLTVEATQLPPGNVEAQARRARYDFLARAAASAGATKIATAHTVDDQAETVLLRLVRGAGRRGLGGIRPRRGSIIRPLLLCDRVQVRHFLAARGLAWRRDRSNFDYALARTRARFGYLPALARELNPRLARALARLADVLREEDVLLDGIAATVPRVGDGVDLDVLRALEAPIARRVIRRWWRRAGSARRLALGHVEAVLELAARARGGGRVRVPGGWVVRNPTTLAYQPGDGDAADLAPYERVLVAGDVVELPGGWRLAVDAASVDAATAPSDDVCVLDADAIAGPLVARNRRVGDRMLLHGLDGHTSIKRLLITRRVPRALRAHYPVVIDGGGEIVWVPRCGRTARALVCAATRRVLVVRVDAAPAAAHSA